MSKFRIAVGYVRCSTDMQEDSPDQQKQAIIQYSAEHGYTILEWYVDFGESGTTFSERPAFNRLLQDVEEKPAFSAVICYDESRWGRAIELNESFYWRHRLQRQGVDVILVHTAVDPDSAYSLVISSLEATQSSQYSKDLSELTLRGKKSNKGRSNGGTAPYGYKRLALNSKTGQVRELTDGGRCIKTEEKVKWMLGEPDEVGIVRRIFELRADGRSYTGIAKTLNAEGVPCPKRGRWRNRDQKWSNPTIKYILENPAYCGTWVFNRISNSRIQAKRKKRIVNREVKYPHFRNDPSEWITEEGTHEPIVSKELWEKANSFRRSMPSSTKPRYDVPYLLRGLVRCSRCGFHYQGQSTRAKKKNYYRYVCGGHNNKGICGYFAVNKDALEQFAINSVKETLSDPSLLAMIDENLRMLIRVQPQYDENELKRLDVAISESEKRTKNLTLALEQGAEIAALVARLRELEVEESKLKAMREELLGRITKGHFLANAMIQVQDFIQNFESRFEAAGVVEKRELLKKWIAWIEINPEKRVAECVVRKIPSISPALSELSHRVEQNEKATLLESPFRRVEVAGTGLEPATFGL
jgi:DNA invertase Pin-like site-specific DNA recombinase